MSLFSNLMGKVFGPASGAEKTDDDNTAASPAAEAPVDPAEVGGGKGAEPAPEPVSEVDVEALLDERESAHPDDLDWKLSIVDLLKLLDLDSSYAGRKEMALELGYRQEDIDSRGSAEMNIWLHRAVMAKIAENGGKLPEGLDPRSAAETN